MAYLTQASLNQCAVCAQQYYLLAGCDPMICPECERAMADFAGQEQTYAEVTDTLSNVSMPKLRFAYGDTFMLNTFGSGGNWKQEMADSGYDIGQWGFSMDSHPAQISMGNQHVYLQPMPQSQMPSPYFQSQHEMMPAHAPFRNIYGQSMLHNTASARPPPRDPAEIMHTAQLSKTEPRRPIDNRAMPPPRTVTENGSPIRKGSAGSSISLRGFHYTDTRISHQRALTPSTQTESDACASPASSATLTPGNYSNKITPKKSALLFYGKSKASTLNPESSESKPSTREMSKTIPKPKPNFICGDCHQEKVHTARSDGVRCAVCFRKAFAMKYLRNSIPAGTTTEAMVQAVKDNPLTPPGVVHNEYLSPGKTVKREGGEAVDSGVE